MTETPTQTPESSAEILARSLFGFAFLGLIAAIVTWIALLLSPDSSNETFSQIRTGISAGFGIVTLAILGVTVWLYRHPPAQLLPLSRRFASVLANRWLALITLFLVLEINFFAFLTLRDVAPTITGPGKFLLVCWSLLLLGIILTINWQRLRSWINQTNDLWIAVGVTLTLFIIVVIFYLFSFNVIQQTGIEDRFRSGLDPRELTFYDDGNPAPSARDFWLEQGQMQVQWLPYTYWTVQPFDGEYINIGADGVRYTPSFFDAGVNDAGRVYFFGGSTMWGEGARDAYTIAGHTARLLAENDLPQHVINYGQTGYVSTQDMILFQAQLAQGNIPDVAIFYQGFNDIYSAYLQNYVGIPLREGNRISDVEAGRWLRAGLPTFSLPGGTIPDNSFDLIASEGINAEVIVSRYLANVRMIRAVAADYNVEVIFVWQPAILFKDTLAGAEATIIEQMESDNPGFIDLYREVDRLLRERVENRDWDDIIVISDLFVDDVRPIFHDLVHITEDGNFSVAQAILPGIIRELENN